MYNYLEKIEMINSCEKSLDLAFLYNNLKLFTNKIITKIYDYYMNLKFTFVSRKIKIYKRTINNGLISVYDSKLSIYKIDNNLLLNIKSSVYVLKELIGKKASNYNYDLIFRLCIDEMIVKKIANENVKISKIILDSTKNYIETIVKFWNKVGTIK